MREPEQKPEGQCPTRRQFIGIAAATLGMIGLPRVVRSADNPPAAGSQPASQPTGALKRPPSAIPIEPAPPWVEDGSARSRVVEIHNAHVVAGVAVHEVVLGEMLAKALLVLTGEKSPKLAWGQILGSAKRIAIKFNQVGAETLRTTDPMARAILQSLIQAGYDASEIALVEAPDHLRLVYGLARPPAGWGAEIRVLDTQVELAKYLYEADAVINVPFLKTHHIAGMSGALKNLSHAVIRHPARYHENSCSPYVGQIVGNREVSGRLKLTIVNALRTVIRNGPAARAEDVVAGGQLLLGRDPVALDAVGHELLMRQRRAAGLDPLFAVTHLQAAARDGLGRRNSHEVDRVKVEHEGS